MTAERITSKNQRLRGERRWFFVAALFAAGAIFVTHDAIAQTREIARLQRNQKTSFTDAQIADGFFRTAFGAEFHLAGRVDRIRKFDGPVRVYADSRGRPDRRKQIANVIADIGKRIRHLDIATTDDKAAANVVVTLVRDRDIGRAIHEFYGEERAREIRKSLDPQCLSGFRKDERYAIQHADVLLSVDNGDFIFYDCAYEEILQSLGPINDTDSVPWTMFNDDVSFGFFDLYDQYLLNILYDPRITPGMTIEEVRKLLPDVLRDVRAWVDGNNKPAAKK